MFKKILLPLDGSELAEKVLPHAKVLAEKSEAEIIIARVTHPFPVMAEYATPTFEVAAQAEQEATEAYLEEIRDILSEANIGVKTVALQSQNVADALIDLAADEKVDLIVMSTHGRSGLSRWIYGSVATKVLQQAPCPVFLVKAIDASAAEVQPTAVVAAGT